MGTPGAAALGMPPRPRPRQLPLPRIFSPPPPISSAQARRRCRHPQARRRRSQFPARSWSNPPPRAANNRATRRHPHRHRHAPPAIPGRRTSPDASSRLVKIPLVAKPSRVQVGTRWAETWQRSSDSICSAVGGGLQPCTRMVGGGRLEPSALVKTDSARLPTCGRRPPLPTTSNGAITVSSSKTPAAIQEVDQLLLLTTDGKCRRISPPASSRPSAASPSIAGHCQRGRHDLHINGSFFRM